MKTMRLKNKVAFITGGSRGIGKAIALRFGKEGANVVITYNTNKEKAEEVVKGIEKMGRKALALKCNVRNTDEVNKTVDVVLKKFGKIDVLVNNAGVMLKSKLLEMSEDTWDETIDVNLKGVFRATKAVASRMVKSKSGKIINIASVSGASNKSSSCAYAASKAGVISLTKIWARELAEHNYNSKCYSPRTYSDRLTQEGVSRSR